MANSGLLQVKGIADIIAGGYPNEIKGVSPAFRDWTNVPDSSDGVTSEYWYRDSNAGINARSSETHVFFNTKWHADLDEYNVFHIHTETYLTKVERIARPSGSSGDAPSLGRFVFAYAPGAPCSPGAAAWPGPGGRFIPYNYNGIVFEGRALIATARYSIPPAKTSGWQSACVYRNVTEGFEHYLCMDTRYTDAMVLGFQFRNNLPAELPVPIWTDTIQTPDICENYMDITLVFSPIQISGAELYVEYRYEGQDWSSDRSAVGMVTRNEPTSVLLPKIVPTNHTSRPQVVYWRAKYRPVRVQMEASDWLYGETQVEYIPAPNMTVPDISVEECTSIGKGDLIPPYTEEQCYTETSCADQDSIRDKLKDLEWEKNRECRIMNGDNSTKGGE